MTAVFDEHRQATTVITASDHLGFDGFVAVGATYQHHFFRALYSTTMTIEMSIVRVTIAPMLESIGKLHSCVVGCSCEPSPLRASLVGVRRGCRCDTPCKSEERNREGYARCGMVQTCTTSCSASGGACQTVAVRAWGIPCKQVASCYEPRFLPSVRDV